MKVIGDSLVLAGTRPGFLCFDSIVQESISVRSCYEPDRQGVVVYEPDRDYVVDAGAGTISRTENSRIADYSQHLLYGKKDFNDREISDYGNHDYFAWVDYQTSSGVTLSRSDDQSHLLQRTFDRLLRGGVFKIIGYGDSIIYGGEASAQHLQFIHRFADHLSELFPDAHVEVENGALPGHTTAEGVRRLDEKVLTRNGDLVLVAFGMNDHIKPSGDGISLTEFAGNLQNIVTSIKKQTNTDIILLSTFPPNPDWFFSTGQVGEYAEATRMIADGEDVAYADVFSVWTEVLLRKDCSSLLANNINHPNDFGHWLYSQALTSMVLKIR